MDKQKKRSLIKKDIFLYFLRFFKLYESYPMNSTLLRCYAVSSYFFQMLSYLYFFIKQEVKHVSARSLCYFYYYMNIINILHYIESLKLSLFVFYLIFTINLVISLNLIKNFLIVKFLAQNHVHNFNFLDSMFARFSNFYLWYIMVSSVEILMIGFNSDNETDYLRKKLDYSDIYILNMIGIIGIAMSVINGVIIFYFNQDYKFLDKSKLRLKLSVKTAFCFAIRILQAILYQAVKNEWIFFLLNYFFFIINLYFYLANIPFKNKTVSVFFISLLCYSFSNLIILTSFRLRFLTNEDDLLPINLIFFITCLKVGQKIYDQSYFFYLLYENKNKKMPLFVLEELVDLNSYSAGQQKQNFLLFGFFAYHPKYCCNQICTRKDKKNNIRDIKNECMEINKKFLIEFIYKNFKDLVENKKTLNYDEEYFEILYAKFISFLLSFGQNPILSYYEIQKTLSNKQNSSIYFSVLSSSINDNIKHQLKFFLTQQGIDSPGSKRKNTYEEFFKSMEIKKNLENKFKRLIIDKIEFFEKTLAGFQTLKDLFLSNLRIAILIKKFKSNLKKLNENAPYSKIYKLKFTSLLNSLILNKITDANLSEKNLNEYFKSKSDDRIDKSFLFDFIGEETVVCEASFLDYKGKILEKSKSNKFMKFFGYFSEDVQKVLSVNDLMPEFIQNVHEIYIENYINQKNKYIKSELSTFALDKGGFVFPIMLNISLKYNQKDDFLLFGAFSKTSDLPLKFCLCDKDGEILNVSNGFFQEFAEEYDFLKISDMNLINIFFLIPDFFPSLDNNRFVQSSKENTYKMFFPKDLKILIDRKKREKARTKSKSILGTNTLSSNYDLKTFKSVNFKDEENYAEVIFDIKTEKYGENEAEISFILFSIKKIKKLKSNFLHHENSICPENVNNTTIHRTQIINDQKSQDPIRINLFTTDQDKNDHFGLKLNTCKQSLKRENINSN